MRKTVKFLTAIALTLLLVFGSSMAIFAQVNDGVIELYKDVFGNPETMETFTFRIEGPGITTPVEVTIEDPELEYWVFSQLQYGEYTITEISIPDNYIANSEVQTFTISEDSKLAIVTFENTYIPPSSQLGSITIVKDIVGDTPPVDTFSFQLIGPIDHEENTTRDFTIDGEDSTTFNNLIPGVYRIIEATPPTNYTIESGNDVLITVEGLSTTTATVTNRYTAPTPVPELGSITIVKDVIGDAPSSNATFSFQLEGPLEDEENMTQNFTIVGEDSVTFNELKQGEYRITELPPPTNYTIESGNNALISIGEVLNPVATVTNRYTTPTPPTPVPEVGSITVVKDIIGDTPSSNATFSFQLEGPLEDEENMTQNFNIVGEGSITFNDLKQGDYRLTELSPPTNYTIESGNNALISIGEVLNQTATVTNRYTTPPTPPATNPDPDPEPDPEPEPDQDRGTVRVIYVDTENNSLDPIFEFSGPVGTNYGTAARAYEDLELVATPVNAFGTFMDDVIEVTYVYSTVGESVLLPEPELPLGVPEVPEESVVPEEETVPEEEVALEEEIVLDEEIPLADALPQTGQLPAELFYAFGTLISMIGVAFGAKGARKNR